MGYSCLYINFADNFKLQTLTVYYLFISMLCLGELFMMVEAVYVYGGVGLREFHLLTNINFKA